MMATAKPQEIRILNELHTNELEEQIIAQVTHARQYQYQCQRE